MTVTEITLVLIDRKIWVGGGIIDLLLKASPNIIFYIKNKEAHVVEIFISENR